MKKRKARLKLRSCLVSDGRHQHIGFLFFQTASVIVLLNNVLQNAALGLLRSIRTDHVEPGGDIDIFPKAKGYKVTFVDVKL